MTDIHEFWIELFGEPPSPTEAGFMKSVLKKVDSSDSVLVQSAVMIRMLYLILVRDKASPLRSIRDMAETMDDLKRRVQENRLFEEKAKRDLNKLYWDVDDTVDNLREARDYVTEHRSFLSRLVLTKAVVLFGLAAFVGTMMSHFAFWWLVYKN